MALSKKQAEILNTYDVIMNLLMKDPIQLINQENKRTLGFYKSSCLWIVKDEKGNTISKHFMFMDAIKSLRGVL